MLFLRAQGKLSGRSGSGKKTGRTTGQFPGVQHGDLHGSGDWLGKGGKKTHEREKTWRN